MTPDEKFQTAIKHVRQGALDLIGCKEGSPPSEALGVSLQIWASCQPCAPYSAYRSASEANVISASDVSRATLAALLAIGKRLTGCEVLLGPEFDCGAQAHDDAKEQVKIVSVER